MMQAFETWLAGVNPIIRTLAIAGLLMALHYGVSLVRTFGVKFAPTRFTRRMDRLRTVASLLTSAAVASIYFAGLGLILKEFGLSLKTYLASASVMGLALGFGLQGLVQDIVTGVTLVFSDLIDVGDMVEISGQPGIVRSIGVRFLSLENSLGAIVSIPNRTIANVIKYPRGYVRALVDVTLPADRQLVEQAVAEVTSASEAMFKQVPGMFITPPSVEGRLKPSEARDVLRIKFRIWPGRGSAIETTFKSELVQKLKVIDPAYADWMVSVNYEAEQKVDVGPVRRRGM